MPFKNWSLVSKIFLVILSFIVAMALVGYQKFDSFQVQNFISIQTDFIPASVDQDIRTADSSDVDGDGLDNQFEFGIMNKFKPKLIYDDQEHNILTNQDPMYFDQYNGVVYLYQVSPVDCSLTYAGDKTKAVDKNFGNISDPRDPPTVLLTIVALYPYDYLPYDTVVTSEQDVFAHNGDVEALKFCLIEDTTPSSYKLYFLHVRRHGTDAIYGSRELTWIFYNTSDHPVLYVSEGKHAVYKSKDECQDAVSGFQYLAWEEDCGGGKEIWPTAYDSATNRYFNVGEYEPFKSMTLEDMGLAAHFKQTATYLGSNYIPEYIWSPFYDDVANRQGHFCGGVDVITFNGTHQVIDPGYSAENCPGGIAGEFWIAQNTSELDPCFEMEYDRKGGDYQRIVLPKADPFLCQAACAQDPNCMSFSYLQPGLHDVSAVCYLKNMAPFPSIAHGIISGVRKNCASSGQTTSSGSSATTCLEYNTDRWGSDYRSFFLASADPAECKNTCISDTNCMSFTYVPPGIQGTNAVCHLKNAAPSPTTVQGVVSGLRTNCR